MMLAGRMDLAAQLLLEGIGCGTFLVKPLAPATPAKYRRLAEESGLASSNDTGYSDLAHRQAKWG